MRRHLLAASLICLVGTRTICAQIRSAPDTEFWNELDLSAHLRSRLTVTVPVVVRDSTRLADPQLSGAGSLFDYAVSKHVTVTGGYLFVVLPNTGMGYNVHVPLAAVTLKTRIKRLSMGDRSRAEGLLGLPQDPIRWRNKLVLNMAFAGGRWQPFVSDEVFYDFSKSAWTQNRFQAGISHELNSRLRLDLFYLERNARKADPAATHAFGTTFQIKLARHTHREGLPYEEN